MSMMLLVRDHETQDRWLGGPLLGGRYGRAVVGADVEPDGDGAGESRCTEVWPVDDVTDASDVAFGDASEPGDAPGDASEPGDAPGDASEPGDAPGDAISPGLGTGEPDDSGIGPANGPVMSATPIAVAVATVATASLVLQAPASKPPAVIFTDDPTAGVADVPTTVLVDTGVPTSGPDGGEAGRPPAMPPV
jgi:hypothetical protein